MTCIIAIDVLVSSREAPMSEHCILVPFKSIVALANKVDVSPLSMVELFMMINDLISTTNGDRT